MKKHEQDRRKLKTLQAIHDALLSLMLEKPYNKITIQDIIDRANVGRSTFYSHYATKDELLIRSLEQMLEMMNELKSSSLTFSKEDFRINKKVLPGGHYLTLTNEHIASHSAESGDKSRLIPVYEFFEHIKENSRLVKALIKGNSVDLFLEKVQSFWNNKLEAYLHSQLPKGQEPKVPIPVLIDHISSTFIFLLKWWVDNKMQYSPAQMDQFFQELINPSIQSIIHNNSSLS